MSMFKMGARGKDGYPKALQADEVGNLKVNNSNNTTVAKHVAQPVANRYMGADGSVATDIATVKPAEFTNFRGRALYVVNNTTVSVGYVKVFGFVDINNSATSVEIGNTGVIAPGVAKLFNADSLGLENINYGIYEGIVIQVAYGAAGTGTASFYLLGESQPSPPKIVKTTKTGRQTIQAINDVGRKITREITLSTPEGIKGAIVTLKVTALNGTDPSLLLYTSVGSGGVKFAQLVGSSSIKTVKSVTHLWLPGANLGDATVIGDTLISEISPQTQLTLNAVIGGIDTGTGIDYTCDVTWLI